jgi:Tfp pilus assembly protein PilV
MTSQAGITMIETLLAASILVIGSLGMLGVVIGSIATNNRNRIDSTQSMLATSILEQIDSTVIGSGSSNLVDCANNTWSILTAVPTSGVAGAPLSGAGIDFTQAQVAGYSMNYVVSTSCPSTTGAVQGTYDVRWNITSVGSPTTTSTYLLTVGAKLKNHGEGNLYFSSPITLRVMSGN